MSHSLHCVTSHWLLSQLQVHAHPPQSTQQLWSGSPTTSTLSEPMPIFCPPPVSPSVAQLTVLSTWKASMIQNLLASPHPTYSQPALERTFLFKVTSSPTTPHSHLSSFQSTPSLHDIIQPPLLSLLWPRLSSPGWSQSHETNISMWPRDHSNTSVPKLSLRTWYHHPSFHSAESFQNQTQLVTYTKSY